MKTKINATMGRYIARLYIKNTLMLLFALLSIIYLFDTVELLRRAAKVDGVPLILVLQMSLLKLPEVGQILFPFAVLFGAIYTFWMLNRRHELVVLRSAGFAVWQILAPALTTAALIGVLHITMINPLGALFVGKFEQLENTFLKRQENQIAVFKEGLWLRQGLELKQGSHVYTDSYVIFHAAKIYQKNWTLKNVSVLYFDSEDTLLQRVDSKTANLEPGQWVFRDVIIHAPGGDIQNFQSYTLPTLLTAQDVEESFASPATMSFWNLPGFINTLEETGFDTSALRVHYQTLLAQPLLFAAMILLAASVSMRPPRQRGGFLLISAGVFIGFLIFFMSSFLQALGASQQIPIILAAWSPALISLMLGVSIILHLEDG